MTSWPSTRGNGWELAVDHVEVGVADPAGGDVDDLTTVATRTGLGVIVTHLEASTDGREDDRTHQNASVAQEAEHFWATKARTRCC